MILSKHPKQSGLMQGKKRRYRATKVMDLHMRPERYSQSYLLTAIFVHFSRETFMLTEDCIVLSRRRMVHLVPYLSGEAIIRMRYCLMRRALECFTY